MNLTSSAETITCARPGCGATTTLADSVYVDGCGQICPECDEVIFGPLPEWWNEIVPRSKPAVLTGCTWCPVRTPLSAGPGRFRSGQLLPARFGAANLCPGNGVC